MAKSNFIVRGGADFSNINKALTKTQEQFTGFQSKISKSMSLVKTALAGIAVGKIVKDSTQMAMTVESSINNISRTMGKSSSIFNKWALTQSKAYGMAKSEAFEYGAVYSNLISGFTKDTSETQKYTTQLLQASAVIASKTGRTIDDVSERIRSGLLGNTEAIEDVGIYAQVAMLKSTAAFKKMANGRTWDQLSYYEQQQVRIMSILEQANIKYGNSLAGTTATKQQFFIATLKNIQLNLGQAFLPIYNVILPALTSLASYIEKITAHLAAFSQALFGKSVQYQVNSTASAIDNQASSVSDLGDAAQAAGKKAQKAVAGFDELNIIGSKSSGSGSGAGSGGAGGSSVTPIETTNETNAVSALDKLKDAIQPTLEAFGRLKDALEKPINFVKNGIASFFNDVLVPIGKWTLGFGLPALLDVVTNLVNSIDWSKLTNAFINFNKALAPFAIAVGTGLIYFIQSIAELLTPVIAGTVSLFADAVNLLGNAIKSIPKEVAIAIGGAIGGLVTSILLFNTANSAIANITSLKGAIGGLLKVLTGNPLATLAIALGSLAGASLALGKAQWNASSVGKYVAKLNELFQSTDKLNNQIKETLKNNEEKRKDIESEYGAVSILSQKYFDLADKTKLTNQQQLLLKSYAQELIDKIPELSKLIDSQTGSYKGTKEEISSLIDKTKEYYLVQAAQDELINLAKEQYDAEKKLNTLEAERSGLLANIKQKQDEYNASLQTGSYQSRGLTDEQKKQIQHTQELDTEISALKNQLDTANNKILDTKKSQKDLNTEWDYATGYISKYSTTAKTSMDSFTTSVSTALSSVSTLVKNFKLPDLKVAVNVDTSALNNVTMYGKGVSNVISKYATGGFPDVGQLFIANEAGPELVGNIGNRTAVANQDQITSGIKQGVFEAVMAAMGNQGNRNQFSGDIIMQVGEEEIARVAMRGQQKINRRMSPIIQGV